MSMAYRAGARAAQPAGAEREHLILKFAPLVRHVVGRLAIVLPQVYDRDDLLGYGTIGLIEAVDRYDPSRGASFETFAAERIRGSIVDALRDADWVPRSTRRRCKEIQRTFSQLEESLGRAPSDGEIAAALNLSLAQVHRAMADAVRTIVSLDRAVRFHDDDDSASTLIECITDGEAGGPGAVVETQELRRAVQEALGCLDEREKLVLSLYYERSLTLREISAVLGISESRVWQLHARAILRIRTYMERQNLAQCA
jgi:RNA polymerase sigma factor for flagellar operon FliA